MARSSAGWIWASTSHARLCTMAATIDDVRRIALGLPETIEVVGGQRGGAAWRTRSGLFVWERGPGRTDLAKLAELGRSWPDGTVVGVRTDGIDGKQALLESFPQAFFTIAHFEGYPAVLVRLDTVDLDLLREVVTDAWLLRASKRAATEWLAANPPPSAPER